jgi:pantoate--beta-alanine ligase
MIEVNAVADLKAAVAGLRAHAGTVAFVPTMGNLHAGHRRLMEVARKYAPAVVVSVYVNPLQFGASEDFAAYPRTPAEDRALLEDAGVDLLFTPGEREIYPRGREAHTQVEVPGISATLEGEFRPGHFRGVATVVSRLFHIVAPEVALFGKKDYQQLMVIRLMAEDFALPVEIVAVDTVRDADGLALSSRNAYLGAEERRLAPKLYAALDDARRRVQDGEPVSLTEQRASTELRAAGFRPEYVSIRRQADLAVPGPGDSALVALAAAWLGGTRLIDNVEFTAHLKPPA